MKLFLLTATFAVTLAAALFADNDLTATESLRYLVTPSAAESFDAYYFAYGTLPRIAAALIGGAVLGLAGSVLQQLTQNPLTSPLTLGTSSGAWFALVLMSAFFPQAASEWLTPAAFAGALLSFGLIVLIAGVRALTGISVIISGMVVNLLFGALATAVILLHSDFIQNVFLWGAGDLTQNGWGGIAGLVMKVLPAAFLLLIFAPRALALIALGDDAARARGLPVVPVFIGIAALAVWMVSAFVTTAGVINFTGLIAPNIARLAGFRSPGKQLAASLVIGMLLLLITDTAAVMLSTATGEIVPTGVVSAVIGTPLFVAIVLAQRSHGRMAAEPETQKAAFISARTMSGKALWVIAALFVLLTVFELFAVNHGSGWEMAPASAYELALRVPRLVTALFAGAALAAAGVIMQRLTGNPLASPDILGVSSGAVFAMVAGSLFFGATVGITGSVWGLAGSVAVLVVLLFLSRASHYAPSVVILLGIAVSAFLDSATALALSRGTMENYYILQWLSGSTYRTSTAGAALLAAAASVLIAVTFAVSRSLTLLAVGRDFAASRGLGVSLSALGLLTLCALLCASATAAMGPVAFVGLVAPHMAAMIGARTVRMQLASAVMLGALIVGWADWLGQVLIAPAQIPAGTLAAILGSLYFLILLVTDRKT